MKITLDAVEALEAIQETGSFAAAAKRLHKVQSAVSYGIKSLEEALGVELFDRTGHRARLTDAGRVVLDEGRLLLARARRLEALAEGIQARWEPRLEVVVDGILPIEPILRAFRQLSDEGVPTRLQVRVEFLGGVQDRFERDRADLMLVKDYTPSRALAAHSLPEVEAVLVAAKAHPLAHAGGPVSLEALHRHVELTVHDSSQSQRLTNPHRFGGDRVFFLSDFLTKKAALLMGLGYGWMPLYLVREELASRQLREVPYAAGSRYRFVPSLVHPVDRPLGRAGQRLLALLTERPAAPRPPAPRRPKMKRATRARGSGGAGRRR
ncbi:LysR family transcriptional regulator [Myxococcaceae bacterium GXIMD 01537]